MPLARTLVSHHQHRTRVVCLVPSGFGNYLARPLFRDQEDKLPSMDEASATKLLHDALKAR
jgi:hypothetical protein